jgi:mannose-6-phosphate isomerase-like protein (cupin superfamily)
MFLIIKATSKSYKSFFITYAVYFPIPFIKGVTMATRDDDPLSQVLNSMRISGSLLLKEKYEAPWAVSVPSSNTLNHVFETATNTRIAAFHLIERGHMTIELENGESTLVEAGEMAVCFSGLDHSLSQGKVIKR